jgi:MFS family permease
LLILNPSRVLASLVPEPGARRVYALSILINSFGFGLILTAMPLYATRVVHLSSQKTGLGLTIASLIGLLAALPIGDLADRRGPRVVVSATMLVQCAAAISYLFVRDFPGFVAVATLDLLAMNASISADMALLRRVGGEEATEFRASIQAIANLGISLGVVGCGIAVQINTASAYRSLFVVNAATFLVGAVILSWLPHYQPLPKPEKGPRWEVLSDKQFIAYTALSGGMFIQYFVIIFLLPLWVVDHTHAPRWSVSLFVLINTILVVLLQVRVGRQVETLRQGGAALRRAGIIFLFSCTAIGLAAGIPGWAALLLLSAAVALHTYGELWHASASFAMDFGLAPEHAQGQYQGLAGLGTGIGQAASPVLLIGVVLSFGRLGFAVLGICFALLGLMAPALARWGERTRPAGTEAAEGGHPIVVD